MNKRTMSSAFASILFMSGGLGGLLVMALAFPGNTVMQVLGIVVGEAAVVVLGAWRSTR